MRSHIHVMCLILRVLWYAEMKPIVTVKCKTRRTYKKKVATNKTNNEWFTAGSLRNALQIRQQRRGSIQ